MSLDTFLRIPILIMPVPVAETIANLAYQRVMVRHPSLFERLESYRDRMFCFVATDWSIAFLARPSERRIAVRRLPVGEAVDVRVEAPFGVLLRLLQGDVDGDALFFSRDIDVTGDMEALLALRNSLDDAHVDLVGDILGTGNPLEPLVRAMIEHRHRAASKGAG